MRSSEIPRSRALPDERPDARADRHRRHQRCGEDPDEQTEPTALDGALAGGRIGGLLDLHLPLVGLVDHRHVLDVDLTRLGRRIDPVQHAKTIVTRGDVDHDHVQVSHGPSSF